MKDDQDFWPYYLQSRPSAARSVWAACEFVGLVLGLALGAGALLALSR